MNLDKNDSFVHGINALTQHLHQEIFLFFTEFIREKNLTNVTSKDVTTGTNLSPANTPFN